MLAQDQAVPEFTLPPIDLRALARRAALPALLAGGVLVAVMAGGQVHVFVGALRRALSGKPGWAAVGVVFECTSLAGYVALLSLVAGRSTARIGARESAQITLAGAAATRLLPTAGAGGAALTVWALRRAGMRASAAARTLLCFFVLLYAVFLGALALAGASLAFGLSGPGGPIVLSVIPAAVAALIVVGCLALGSRRRPERRIASDPRWARVRRGAELVGDAVRDAIILLRSRDARLAGAAAYWAFDAAVLWAMLHAFGSPPALPVVALAYLVGQVANTIPLPGSVSGGMVGVLIAFGVPAGLALPSVIAYRTIAVWLPTPAAAAAIPALRATVARWERERDSALAPAAAE